VLLLDDLGCRGEDSEGRLALCGVLRLARLEEGAQQFWPRHACDGQDVFALSCAVSITFVRVLARELCDGVADLASHRVVRLVGQAGEQLGADGLALGWVECQEEVHGAA
jgi:hypothetical protein